MGEPSSATSLVCDRCAGTERAAERPKSICARCRLVAYCCTEHQEFDWDRHRVDCDARSSTAAGVPATATAVVTMQQIESISGLLAMLQQQAASTAPPAVDQSVLSGAASMPSSSLHAMGAAAMQSAPLLGPPSSLGLPGYSAPPPPSDYPTLDAFGLLLRVLQQQQQAQTTPLMSLATSSSSTQEIIDPKSSMTVPPLPSNAVAEVAAEAAPSIDTNFIGTMTLDWKGIHSPKPLVEDDDCTVIEEKINRRYKDHMENVVYDVTNAKHIADLRTKGEFTSIHDAAVLRMRYISEHILQSLNCYGWGVVDNFLENGHAASCYREMVNLYKKDKFEAANVKGTIAAEGIPALVRNENDFKNLKSDHIHYYDGVDTRDTDEAVTTRRLVSMLDAMIQHFQSRLDGKSIDRRTKAMLAIYPGGSSGYKSYIDDQTAKGPVLTCIYFCNENWNLKEHGGALRLHPKTSQYKMDVAPKADRLVFVWNDRQNPHEVMAVHRNRCTVTIWYTEKEEGKEGEEPVPKRPKGVDTKLTIRATGSERHGHQSTPHMSNAAAAATVSTASLEPSSSTAASGQAGSSRSRSDNDNAEGSERAHDGFC